MFAPVIVLALVVTMRIYKKSAPNGKLTVYLGKRDFVDRLNGDIDPIDGVIVVDTEYLKGRKVYGQIVTTFRYGREEDEVMGLKFSRDLYLVQEQVFPTEKTPIPSKVQERLLRKLGEDATPFVFTLPPNAPSSVTLQPGSQDKGRPLGVEYELRLYVADSIEEKPQRRNSVGLAVRKVQYAPLGESIRQPSTMVSKGFTLTPGRIQLEVTLDRDLYYHGDRVCVSITVGNRSKKTVRSVRVAVIQFCEVLMVNEHYTKAVATIESKEGCPITPGSTLTKSFYLFPVAANNKDRRGIALDGRLKDEDVNLASSSLVPEGGDPSDMVGIAVSYAVRIRLDLGTLGGELVTDLPFKLMHPAPGSKQAARRPQQKSLTRQNTLAHQDSQNAFDSAEEDNLVFEDFAKLRMSMTEE